MKFLHRYIWLLPTLGLVGLTAGALATGGGYPGGGYPGGGYPGGGWTVTDQAGNPLSTNPNGGYDLRGPMTGDVKLTGAYPDVFTAAQQPNPTVGYAFIPNPNDYQGWLFNGGSTPPGGGYDPLHIWTGAQAFNQAGPTGWLGNPWNESINGSVTANTGGTLWAVFQWNGSSQPPDHLDVLLRTTVSASASASTYGSPPQPGGSATATATDSTFNETATASSGGSGGGVPLVTGRHLLRVPVDPSTKKAQVSLGGTTTAMATADVPYGVIGSYPGTTSGGYYQVTNGPAGANASASIGARASIDSRDVIIQSDLGQTYHKGSYAIPEANVRQPDGTLTDDTVVASADANRNNGDFGVIVNYQAVPKGSWGANSSYAWSNTATQWVATPSTQLQGNFNPGSIPPMVVDYYNLSSTIPGSPGTTDHVRVFLADGQDGATAAANYYLNFHNAYENPVTLTDVTQYGVWQRVSPSAVSGPNGGPFPLPIQFAVSVTTAVSPSGPAGDAVASFFGVTVGATYSTAVPRDGSQWQMLPNKYCWIEDQPFWEHMAGTADSYQRQGYVGPGSWSLDKPIHASSPLGDFTERIVSSDSPPGF